MKDRNSWSRKVRNAKPKSVSDVLSSTFRAFGIEEKIKDYALVADWEGTVGPLLAAVAVPEKITRNGILVVRVADATWAQEITLLKTQILSSLQSRPEGPMIQDIRFVVSGPREMEQRKHANR